MKTYYITGIVGGIALFLIMFIIGSCSSCIDENNRIKGVEDYSENKIALRYYLTDDYNNSQVGFLYISKGKSFSIDYFPKKEGYRFLGWYDNPNLQIARMIADKNGFSKETVNTEIILYPIFEKES